MNPALVLALLVTAATGAGVVANREPAHQAIALGVFGLALALLFVLLQAPEVALSQLAVGGVLVPLLYFAAIVRTSRRSR